MRYIKKGFQTTTSKDPFTADELTKSKKIVQGSWVLSMQTVLEVMRISIAGLEVDSSCETKMNGEL